MKRHRGSQFGRGRPYGPGLNRARAPRLSDAGIARGPGLLVAFVTAAIVFGIGYQLFPVRPKQVPPAPPAAPVTQQPTPPPVVDAGGIATAPAADAGSVTAR